MSPEDAEREMTERLSKVMRGEATANELVALRIAIRSRGEITLHALHNAVTSALEEVSTTKLVQEATGMTPMLPNRHGISDAFVRSIYMACEEAGIQRGQKFRVVPVE